MPHRSDNMMEELERGVILICNTIIAIAVISIVLAAIAWWMQPVPQRRVIVQPSAVEARRIAQRHAYHGITVSICEDGKEYFYRDGKRCKL